MKKNPFEKKIVNWNHYSFRLSMRLLLYHLIMFCSWRRQLHFYTLRQLFRQHSSTLDCIFRMHRGCLLLWRENVRLCLTTPLIIGKTCRKKSLRVFMRNERIWKKKIFIYESIHDILKSRTPSF